MALTNFAALTSEQKTAWSMDMWKAARNNMFLNRFVGTSANSMIHRITELKKTEKGARAVITLIPDLEGDGIAGDRQLEGNEEALQSFDQVIQIDQLRHANRSQGRIAEQKSIVNFRKESRDVLAYWLADRYDQQAILTLSGVAFTKKMDDTARTGSQFSLLDYAGDISAPSTNRYLVWDATGFGVNSANTDLVAADTPTWGMIVDLKALAKERYVKPLRGDGGEELYYCFMTPTGFAKLKQETNFLAAWRSAMPRSKDNPLFKGKTDGIMIDGIMFFEYRHVYHSATWGSGAVAGQRILFCGAQALGFADIGLPTWVEKEFDYDNQPGISTGKICGFKKPVFRSAVSATDEDFGVICVDTAI